MRKKTDESVAINSVSHVCFRRLRAVKFVMRTKNDVENRFRFSDQKSAPVFDHVWSSLQRRGRASTRYRENVQQDAIYGDVNSRRATDSSWRQAGGTDRRTDGRTDGRHGVSDVQPLRRASTAVNHSRFTPTGSRQIDHVVAGDRPERRWTSITPAAPCPSRAGGRR